MNRAVLFDAILMRTISKLKLIENGNEDISLDNKKNESETNWSGFPLVIYFESLKSQHCKKEYTG